MTNFNDFVDIQSLKDGSKSFQQVWLEMTLAVEAFAEGADKAIDKNGNSMKVLASMSEKLLAQFKKLSDEGAIAKITKQAHNLAAEMNVLDAENKKLMKSSEMLRDTLVDAEKEYNDLNKAQKENSEQTQKNAKEVETYAGKMAVLAIKLADAKKEASKFKKENDDLGFNKASKDVEKFADKLQGLKQAEKDLQKAQKERSKTQSNQAKQAEKEILSQVNSLEGLRAKLSLLTAKRNKITIGTEGFDKAQKEIKELNEELSKLEQDSGDFRRSVGDYKNAIVGAFDATGGLGSKITGLASGLAEAFGTGGALAAAGFVVTELVGLFGDASEAIAEINTEVSQVGATLSSSITKGLVESGLSEADALKQLPEQVKKATASIQSIISTNKFAETSFEELTLATNSAVQNFGTSAEDFAKENALLFSRLGFQSQRDDVLFSYKEYGENLGDILGLTTTEFSALAKGAADAGIFEIDTIFDRLNEFSIQARELDIQKDLGEFFPIDTLKRFEQLKKQGDFKGLLQEISAEALKLPDSRKQIQALQKAFGSLGEEKGAIASIKLFANLGGVTEEYANSLTDAEKRTLKLVETNKKVAESQIELAQKFKGTGQTFELLGAQLKAISFQFLVDSFDFISERIDIFTAQFKDTFADLDEGLDDIGLQDLIEGLKVAGEEILKTLGIILDFAGQLAGSHIKNIINGFLVLKDVLSGVLDFIGVDFVDLIDRGIDQIQGFVSSIGLLFETLGRNIQNLRDAFAVIVDFIPKFADAIAKNPITVAITKEIKDFEKFVTETFNDIVKFFTDIFDSLGIADVFREQFSEIIDLFNVFSSETTKAGSDFQKFTDILAQLFKGGVGVGIIRTVALIGDAVSTLFEQIFNRAGDFAQSLELLLSGDLAGAKDLFSDTIDSIKNSSGDAIFAGFEESLKQVTGQVEEQTTALQTNNAVQKDASQTVESNTKKTTANTSAVNKNAEAQKKVAEARKEANEFLVEQNAQLQEAEIALLQAQGKEREAFLREQTTKELEIQKEFAEEQAKIIELQKSGGLSDADAQTGLNTITKEFLAEQEVLTIETNERLAELDKERVDKAESLRAEELEKQKSDIESRFENAKTLTDKESELRRQKYLDEISNTELSEKEKAEITERYELESQDIKDKSVELEIDRLQTLNELDALSKGERLENEVQILALQNQLSDESLSRQKERDAERLESTKNTLSQISELSKEVFGQLNELTNQKADNEINSLNREQEIRQGNLDAQIELAKTTSTSEIDFAGENEKLIELEQRKAKVEKKRVTRLLLISLLERGTDALTASSKVAEILSGVGSIQSKKEGGFIQQMPFLGVANPFSGGRTAGTNPDHETLVRVHGNEFVMNHKQVQENPELVSALDHNLKFGTPILPDYGDFKLLEKQSDSISQYFAPPAPRQELDYPRIGREMYQAMSKSASENRHYSEEIFDKNGDVLGIVYVDGNRKVTQEFQKPLRKK